MDLDSSSSDSEINLNTLSLSSDNDDDDSEKTNIEKLPCEFCEELIPITKLIEHQVITFFICYVIIYYIIMLYVNNMYFHQFSRIMYYL